MNVMMAAEWCVSVVRRLVCVIIPLDIYTLLSLVCLAGCIIV